MNVIVWIDRQLGDDWYLIFNFDRFSDFSFQLTPDSNESQ